MKQITRSKKKGLDSRVDVKTETRLRLKIRRKDLKLRLRLKSIRKDCKVNARTKK